MDFYIATKIGAIFGGGYSVKTKGLGQFGITGETRKNLQEKCILSANENRTRTEAIREQLKPVKLEIEFAKYQERIKIRGILEEAFLGNRYEEYSDRT